MPASSANEASEILRREPAVDLVITDHAMPQMTGAQLADAVHKEWPELPVILATGTLNSNLEPAKACASVEPFTEGDLAAELARDRGSGTRVG